VLEYTQDSDLHNYMTHRCRGTQRLATTQHILPQICAALHYLETVQVAHRDVKPENTLVHCNSNNNNHITIKLCDFGWATWFRPQQRQTTLCGTTEFVPPEMLEHSASYYAEYVDRWMLGVMTIELVTASTPFSSGSSKDEIFDQIRGFRGISNKENQPPEYVDFVERLLQRTPHDRMSAAAAMEHSFLRSKRVPITVASPTVAQRRQLFQPVSAGQDED